MLRLFCLLATVFMLVPGAVGYVYAEESPVPEIIAQGFEMSEVQEGQLGAFSSLRVRFEVPERIAELYIKERSYDVDLARTPEQAHFLLFGVKTQMRQLTDVTLDFQNYINHKIEAEGTYTFDLRVTDRKGKSAIERLTVRVFKPPTADEVSAAEAVSVETFRFERSGASAVAGTGNFGISWRTIDGNEVLIQLFAAPNSSSTLIELSAADYDQVTTRAQLEQKVETGRASESILLPTAAGSAVGSVFGIYVQGKPYLIKITGSETSLSRDGTSVILVGEYKH
jgi:hypothetical protein